ncbi:MAG: NAD(P)(+) transhydrogenase (Re/Si-specific) subunit beta [Actinobacteria bacterium]|nr:NAD(P)(+) transhydrogenase (Re/Si-specific) subunit beta [Actinomycetota bacterium]
MNLNLRAILYLAAAVAFIIGLKRLSGPRTARSGNMIGALGMLLAIVVTLFDELRVGIDLYWQWVVLGIVVGGGIGALLALRVKMTEMPQLVAAFNGFGGLASALVAGAVFLKPALGGAPLDMPLDTMITVILSVIVGAVTFTGSFIAYAKLQGLISGAPITYKGQQIVNSLILAGIVGFSVWTAVTQDGLPFWVAGAISLVLGVLFVIPIGGADMPVVIALLNSFSGIAAAMTGFVINNPALIIGGALVGASGLILTNLMCVAMNRPLTNVLFGAFGSADSSGGGGGAAATGDKRARSTTPDDVAIALAYAEQVMVVPGYGLAVAQAQHAMRELDKALQERGVKVAYGIHPVAGRMPGHMNVLLAEADVPYEALLDIDAANALLQRTDVVLVVGANDVVNPSARTDTGSPIYGMPILNVDSARSVVVIKRSLSPGFAGIDNPLFYLDNTQMLFSDAKKAITELERAIHDV